MRHYRRQLTFLLLPFLLGTLLLTLIPALATVGLAFTEFNTIAAPQWNGLANFPRLFASPLVRTSLYSSLYFLALAVPLRLLAALVLALLLQSERRPFGLFRATVYLPTVIPEAAYALIWLWIFNPLYGPLNLILGALGVTPPAWLVNPTTARLAFVIMSLFQIGEGFVIILAGLQTIPRSFYEAARVDGASRWQSFRRLTLPLITPWLLLLTCRDLLVSLQNTFTPSFIMTYGGPYYATTFIPLLIYEVAFDFFDFGLAAAILLLAYILIGLIILGIVFLVDYRRGEYGWAE